MKKLSQILAIMAIILAPLVVGGTAFAASTCPVGYTGPNSNNICTSTTTYTCNVNTITHLATVNNNDQTAESGISLTGGNTQSGSSSTGSATNSNNVTFNVTVTNSLEGDGVCTVAVTTPATTTPVVTVVAPKQTAPKVLPDTSSDTTSGYLVMFAATLGVGAIALSLIAMAYRHFQS